MMKMIISSLPSRNVQFENKCLLLAGCLEAGDSCKSIYFVKLPLLPFHATTCWVKWADDTGDDEAVLWGHTDDSGSSLTAGWAFVFLLDAPSWRCPVLCVALWAVEGGCWLGGVPPLWLCRRSCWCQCWERQHCNRKAHPGLRRCFLPSRTKSKNLDFIEVPEVSKEKRLSAWVWWFCCSEAPGAVSQYPGVFRCVLLSPAHPSCLLTFQFPWSRLKTVGDLLG